MIIARAVMILGRTNQLTSFVHGVGASSSSAASASV